jgi:HEAT repeat protein
VSVRRAGVHALLVAVALTTAGAIAQAQPRPTYGRGGSRTVQAGSARAPAQSSTSSLAGRLGVDAARRLLASPSRETRLRGVRRLGSFHDAAAAQALARALEDDAGLLSDDRVRVEAVRALAEFAARDSIRALLTRMVLDDSGAAVPGAAASLHHLGRQRAAFALAAADDTRATDALVGMLLSDSSATEPALEALRAHPPTNLEPLLTTRALETVRVVQLLGELGDLRALPKLRVVVEKGDIAARAAAAVSLSQLGDEYALKACRSWLNQPGTTHQVREASARALVLARAADAPRAVAILLADPATRATALKLAAAAPTPQLGPSLAGYLTIATPAERPGTLLSLARSGGAVALRTLQKQLGELKAPDPDALFALAHLPGQGAEEVLAGLVREPATRRLGVRAALLRASVLGRAPSGLHDALRTLGASRHEVDRELAAFGLAVTGAESPAALLAAKQVPAMRGACRAAWALQRSDREACAALLSDGTPPAARDALAQALGGEVLPAGVSSHILLSWAERSDPLAIVFARALGSRDSDSWRPRIRQLLASGNPVLRAQVALGLASSPSPSATSLLVETYWFETEPVVRRALVRALSARADVQRLEALRVAARLDPDEQTRGIARAALGGARLHEPSSGARWAWISLSAAAGTAAATGLSRALVVMPHTGIAVGALADDDGFALVPGLPSGEVRVVLAPSPATVQASRP